MYTRLSTLHTATTTKRGSFRCEGKVLYQAGKLVPTLTRTSRSVKHHTAVNCERFHVQIVSVFHMFTLIVLKKAVKSRPVHSNSNKNDKHLLASLCARQEGTFS